jgi:hypothetical protein
MLAVILPMVTALCPREKERPGHWEINPEEEKIVRYIYHLYVNKAHEGTAIAQNRLKR